METREQMQKRLNELERETDEVIEQYLSQVAADAKSNRIKELQKKHNGLRKEQVALFDAYAQMQRTRQTANSNKLKWK